jgi:hypothetical protein
MEPLPVGYTVAVLCVPTESNPGKSAQISAAVWRERIRAASNGSSSAGDDEMAFVAAVHATSGNRAAFMLVYNISIQWRIGGLSACKPQRHTSKHFMIARINMSE